MHVGHVLEKKYQHFTYFFGSHHDRKNVSAQSLVVFSDVLADKQRDGFLICCMLLRWQVSGVGCILAVHVKTTGKNLTGNSLTLF